MDRAMQAGIEDVGLGVLFGLHNYASEFVGLLMHAEHLEAVYGAGPHTISVPRLCPADDINTGDFANALPDDIFLKIIALLRLRSRNRTAPSLKLLTAAAWTKSCAG